MIGQLLDELSGSVVTEQDLAVHRGANVVGVKRVLGVLSDVVR